MHALFNQRSRPRYGCVVGIVVLVACNVSKA